MTPQILASDLLRQLAAEAREFPGYHLVLSAHPQVTAILQADGAASWTAWPKNTRSR